MLNKLNKENHTERKLSYVISIISPIAGLISMTIASYSDLPNNIRKYFVVLLGIITLISFNALWGNRILHFYNKLRYKRKKNAIANRYYSEFEFLIHRFGNLFKDRIENIHTVLKDLQSHNSNYRDILPSIHDFNDLCGVLNTDMKNSSKNSKSFYRLIKWFDSILNIYNDHMVCNPVERIKEIKNVDIPEHTIKKYEEQRLHYLNFLEDYEKFAEKINYELGEHVVRAYFTKPNLL